MKSLHWTEGNLAIVMHHNSSFTGDVHINLPQERVEVIEEWAGHVQVKIPFEVLKVLVAEYVTGLRIAAIEDASADDILLGRTPCEIVAGRTDGG